MAKQDIWSFSLEQMLALIPEAITGFYYIYVVFFLGCRLLSVVTSVIIRLLASLFGDDRLRLGLGLEITMAP